MRTWKSVTFTGTNVVIGIALAMATSSAAALVPAPAGVSPTNSILRSAAFDSTVARIQTELNAAGYEVGTADGLIGERTRSAIRAYQRDNGLLVTGQPSETLLNHMRAASAGTSGTGGAADTRQDRREGHVDRLQDMLGQLGYNVPITGEVDTETRGAIREYQRDHGLLVTGRAEPELFRHVREQLDRKETARGSGESPAVSAPTIADIQRGLEARGYAVDDTTGRLTPRTRDAIRQYQNARGITVTGLPSAELAEMLDEGVDPARPPRETVRAVQQALNERGYGAGPADGVMGPSTEAAIREYKSRNGLTANADVNAALLSRLGIEERESASAAGYRTRISDDFSDGDYTSGPSWQVLAQNFTVQDGKLRSTVENRVSDEQIGEQFLRGILGEALGMSLPGGNEAAAIAQSSAIGNAFRISIVLSGDPDDRARINLGPYRGDSATSGYRLEYDSAAGAPLSLLAVGDGETRKIASTAQVARLGDGQFHRIDWTREPDGEMRVTVDGNLAVAVRDQRFEQGFGGFSIVNAGGEWLVDEVTVSSAD